MPVQDQRINQKKQVRDHIERAEMQWDHRVHPAHQGLEGINAKIGVLEHPNADSANNDAGSAHENAPGKMISKIHGILISG